MTCPVVPVPERFQVEDDGNALTIRWRSFKPGEDVNLLVFCILAHLIILSSADAGLSAQGLPFRLVPLIVFGFPIAYVTVAAFVNFTVVRVDREQLSVRHGPLPWPGNLTIPNAEIARFHVVATSRTHPEGAWDGDRYVAGREVLVTTHELFAIGPRGGRRLLVHGLEERSEAEFLQDTLTARLGIPPAM